MPKQEIQRYSATPGNTRGLLVGRFQPFHLGHLGIILDAIESVDTLYLGIGSANKPLDENNPFTIQERKDMITMSVNSKTLNRIKIFTVPDTDNHMEWIESIERMIPRYDVIFTADAMTAELHRKRGIRVVTPRMISRDALSGTVIRSMIQKRDTKYRELLPDGTILILERISASDRLAKFKL